MIMMAISIMFMFMYHPLTMGMTLLIQTIFLAIYIGTTTTNYWFSYILVLIMVGGMLILFVYMTSIASNEKFSLKSSYILLSMIPIIIMMSMSNKTPLMNYTNIPMKTILDFNLSISKFFNYPSNMMFLCLVIYLFITLIAIVSMCKTTKSPLRQMF